MFAAWQAQWYQSVQPKVSEIFRLLFHLGAGFQQELEFFQDRIFRICITNGRWDRCGTGECLSQPRRVVEQEPKDL